MGTRQRVPPSNTLRATVDSLRYVDDAGVTVYFGATATVRILALRDSAGVDVPGLTLPLTLDYVASSQGKFTKVLPTVPSWVRYGTYYALVEGVTGATRWTDEVEVFVDY